MNYLVMIADNIFAADAKARRFTTEYPSAWKFDAASDAHHVAKMLRPKHPLVRALSVKAYEEDRALEAEPSFDEDEASMQSAQAARESSGR